MAKNFRDLRDDLAERVGEDRLARARHDADEEVERYERTLRQLRNALNRTQTDLAARLGTSQAEVSRLERRKDMYLSSLGRYVAALGGRLEVRAVFDDVDVTVPLMIGGDVGPAADPDLTGFTDPPGDVPDAYETLRTLAAGENAPVQKFQTGGRRCDSTTFAELVTRLNRRFRSELGTEADGKSPSDAFAFRRCPADETSKWISLWNRSLFDADVVPSMPRRDDLTALVDTSWVPLLKETLACHALVSRESAEDEPEFARFLATTVKPTLLLQAIMLAAPTRQPLPIRMLVGKKKRGKSSLWSGCAVPVGFRIQGRSGSQVEVVHATEISWQKADDPNETFTAKLDEVELLEICGDQS